MTTSEQETTITYDLGEKKVRIFSAIRRDQRRLEKAGLRPLPKGSVESGLFYCVSLDQFRWRVQLTKRTISPARKLELSRALKARRASVKAVSASS